MIPHSDGTPNSALETMICKKTLIISDLKYNSPLFKNTCLLANPNDIQDVKNKIEIAINNYPKELIENAYQAVNQYGNQQTEMEKVLKLYETELLRG